MSVFNVVVASNVHHGSYELLSILRVVGPRRMDIEFYNYWGVIIALINVLP